MPSWTPAPKPEWVRRINLEGADLDIAGIVPLDEASLIDRAIRNTGLSDFGEDSWREPFSVLVKSLDEEAELTLLGRILTRSDLLSFLEGRLRVEQEYRLHPEIEDEQIDRPLWVIGQGRSGTTLLHTLLALLPGNRTTTDEMAQFPVAIPGWDVAKQRRIADSRLRQWARIEPEVDNIHEFGVGIPGELFRIEAMSFRTPIWFNMLGLPRSYNEYMAKQNSAPLSLAYARRALKLWQWQSPGKQWVIGTNDSLRYLPDVLKVFPGARLVWSHRDPIKAMASAVNMIGTLMAIRSDQKITAAYEQLTDPVMTAAMMSKPIEWLESGLVPKESLCNAQFAETTTSPVTAIAKIYDFFEMQFTDAHKQAIEAYTAAHPRTQRKVHLYSVGKPEQIAAERVAFKRYQEYFSVPNET
ncbi:MAG: sulfotransferase [Steroidobacteraceae bacterium]